MTNVPDYIREAWKDIYILFDSNFAMDGSEDAWEKFWLAGCELIKKHGDNVPLMEIIEAIAHMLESFVNERKTGNKTLLWDKDEDYPHPRKEET
ncbi:MAG: hypothetical protein J6Y60_03380 [Treponema sp.]|nr:hypothetical protein [Treponema sp.]